MLPRTPRRRAVARLVPTALLAVLLTASCAYPAGSGAVVGGESIDQSAVQVRTSTLLAQAPPDIDPSNVALVNRSQMTSMIRHRLIEVAAAEQGVAVSDAELNAVLQGQDEAALAARFQVPGDAVRQTVQDALLLDALTRRLPPDGAAVTDVTVRVEGVGVESRDEAVAARSRFLSDPGSVPGAVADAGEQAVQAELSLLTQPIAAPFGVFAAAAGSVIIFPSQAGYLVLRITDRTVAPARLTAELLAGQQDPTAVLDLQALLLAPYAEREGVSVSPRNGSWDPNAVRVVPTDDGL